jgi:hypothetical protein
VHSTDVCHDAPSTSREPHSQKPQQTRHSALLGISLGAVNSLNLRVGIALWTTMRDKNDIGESTHCHRVARDGRDGLALVDVKLDDFDINYESESCTSAAGFRRRRSDIPTTVVAPGAMKSPRCVRRPRWSSGPPSFHDEHGHAPPGRLRDGLQLQPAGKFP